MRENNPETTSGRGSVERVLRVLSALADLPGPVGARALAEHVQLPDSTVYRLLGTLREAGMVTDLGRDIGFVPGPVCARLGAASNQTHLLEEIALPEMQALSAATRETVGLMTRTHRQMMCLRTVESPQSLRCSVTQGAVLALNQGASAKALLAHAGPAIQRIVLEDEPAERRAALLAELPDIVRRGYAVSDGEVDQGVWGVSVPLFGPRLAGSPLLGGLTLMAPSSRAADRHEDFVRLTRAAGKRISQRLSDGDALSGNAAAFPLPATQASGTRG